MAILHAAAPLLAVIDRSLTELMPGWLALLVWGLVAGAVSTTLYSVAAPEKLIGEVRAAAKLARKRMRSLNPDEAEFNAALSAALQTIKLSLKELVLVSGPALAAVLPILFLAAYLDRAYLHAFPGAGMLKGWEIIFSLGALGAALPLRKILAAR